MATEETLYDKFLLDFENCVDIDEDIANISTWTDLVVNPDNWAILLELAFDEARLKAYFDTLNEKQRQKHFTFGIACFTFFIQRNFTGPFLPNNVGEFLVTERFATINFSKLLSVNNEEVNVNTLYPQLLAAAKVMFSSCHFSEIVNMWWTWRATIIHQQVLDELSPTLLANADRIRKEITSLVVDTQTKAKVEIELAQLYLLYKNVTKAGTHITAACNLLGFKYEMIGKLGKRRRYQETDTAQMAVEVTMSEDVVRQPVNTFEIPRNLALEDDAQLDNIEFLEDDSDEAFLPNLEQKVLLLIIQEMLTFRPANDSLLEEVEPCVNLILNQKNTWSVRVASLLLRCKVEAKNKRTIDRSVKQCEEILACIKKDQPHPLNRIGGVYGTGLQPFWKTLAQYADLLLNLGLIQKSLEIYQQLELWKEVVVCYSLMNLKQNAAEIIKTQFAKKPTLLLYCLLGQAENDVSYFEKAWEFSKRRSFKVQRYWGQYFFTRKQYQECIPHFEKSVSINPLQAVVWYRLGYAALESENWQVAATAYRRYTTLEPDGFEAWNNLAQAYLKLGNKRSAHYALIDALRCNFENWKVWENLLLVSADISHYTDLIRAYHRLLDLNPEFLNTDVLGELVYGVSNNVNDYEGKEAGIFLKKTRELLGRVVSMNPSNGQVWELYASLAPVLLLRAQRLQRAYKGYTQGDWETNPGNCQQVLYVCHKLAEVALDDRTEPKDFIIGTICTQLTSALSAVEKYDWDVTKNLVQDVTGLLGKIVEKCKNARTTSANEIK